MNPAPPATRMTDGMVAHPPREGRIPPGAKREAVIEASRRRLGALVLFALVSIWALSLVRPPLPAAPGLDESWRIGLTLAADRHLTFGRDVVFTYGPLGYVLEGAPDPPFAATRAALLAVLAAITGLGIWSALGGRGNRLQQLALVVALLPFATLFGLEYVALAGIVALLVRAARFPRLAPLVGVAVAVVTAFGMLAKYTLGADVLAAAGAVWLVDAVRGPRRRRRAALTAGAIAFGGTAVGLAAAFGFAPGALGAYLRGAAEITAGYSAAMAVSGSGREVAAALAVALAILLVAVGAWREGKPTALALAAAVLFLTWKHGFVRQDEHVIAYFATAAVLAALVGTMVRGHVTTLAAAGATGLALAAFAWSTTMDRHVVPPFFRPAAIAAGASYLLQPGATESSAAAITAAALQADRLPPAVRARIGPATADAVPVEIATIPANGLNWAPLPVFQSYSAYTPALDALNRDALVAHGAGYVLYEYLAIDVRLPFGEMPATTVELLCRYRAVALPAGTVSDPNQVLLERKPGAACDAAPGGDAGAVAIGRPIPVPHPASRGEFVVASFHLRPALRTRLAGLLWRAPVPRLFVRYDHGGPKEFRLIAATAADGVVVSAAPRDRREGARWLRGEPVAAVRDVTVTARPGTYVLDGVTFTRERRR